MEREIKDKNPHLRIKLLLLCFCIFMSDISIDLQQPYDKNTDTYTSAGVMESSGFHTDMETYWKAKPLALRKLTTVDPHVTVLYGSRIKEWFRSAPGFTGKQNGCPDTLVLLRAISGATALHLLFCVLYYFCLSIWWQAYRLLAYIHNKDGKKTLQVSFG